ncbi:MAG TPA: HDIG domain-containing protein, partial [Blastocatellia bacterium]|nr:HDIG domain-containing protein [Blastocatellia bacterium]
MPARDDAWELLCEYTKGESLRKHALAVEAVMKSYARRLGEDEAKWGITGLLHDFDYEMYPDPPDHPVTGSRILAGRGYPEDIRRA